LVKNYPKRRVAVKLCYAAASPFVRKVMVVLHETGQLGDVEIMEVSTTPVAPSGDVSARNPLSKIPALELADGATLYDSRVICAYLDDRAGAGLYPTGAARWATLTLEATADGIMDAAVLAVYERRIRPEDKQFDDWVEAQWGKVAGGLAALNTKWMDHLNRPMDMGHIAVACALGYLDFRHGDRDWRQSNDALAGWFDSFESRGSMIATGPTQG
jgi:glutathione S-transferase